MERFNDRCENEPRHRGRARFAWDKVIIVVK